MLKERVCEVFLILVADHVVGYGESLKTTTVGYRWYFIEYKGIFCTKCIVLKP